MMNLSTVHLQIDHPAAPRLPLREIVQDLPSTDAPQETRARWIVQITRVSLRQQELVARRYTNIGNR